MTWSADMRGRLSWLAMHEIGDHIPAFELPDTRGAVHAAPLDEAPPATVVVVMCNHCPYVVAWNPRIRAVAEDYSPRGVRFLGINANDPGRYPADSPERMREFVDYQDWPFPYLFDESQDVARALDALVTPHVFVYDGHQRLVYHGAPDADHEDPGNDAAWLRAAIEAALANEAADLAVTRPRGCSVKWKA
jgi:peroxiredoxin